MDASTRRHERDQTGFSVIQIVIVGAIVIALVAVALPVTMSRARRSTLEQNARTLQLELRSYLAQDLDPTYVDDDEAGVATTHLASLDGATGAGGATTAAGGTARSLAAQDPRNACLVFTRAVRSPRRRTSSWYTNPYGGSREVVCLSTLPTGTAGGPPAVWITDDQRYAYDALRTAGTARKDLRGTLVVVFLQHNGVTSAIDVYYVDGSGKVSPAATALTV